MKSFGSYNLTEEQIFSSKKKSDNKEEEEIMEVWEKDDSKDNLAMGRDDTEIEDGEEGGDVMR